MKESSFENFSTTPEHGSFLDETLPEMWRKFSDKIKKMSSKAKLTAVVLVGIAAGGISEMKNSPQEALFAPTVSKQTTEVHHVEQAEQTAKFDEAAYEQDLHLKDPEIDSARKMLTEMPHDFVEMREEALEMIKVAEIKFDALAPKDALMFSNNFTVETWRGRTIFHKDSSTEKKPLEDAEKNVVVEVFSTTQNISNYESTAPGNMPDEWMQMERIVKILTIDLKDSKDKKNEPQPIQVKGIGKDKKEALFHALYNAAKRIHTTEVDGGQVSEDSGSSIPASNETMYESAIKSYRVKSIEEPKGQEAGNSFVTVEIEVVPGTLNKKSA